MSRAVNGLEDLDVDGFLRRSRMDPQAKEKLLGLLLKDRGMSARKMAASLGVKYHVVRSAYAFLGVSAEASLADARGRVREERLEAVCGLLEKEPGIKREQIADRLGLPYYTVARLMKEEGLSTVRLPRHGTAVEYDHFGCRCDVCTVANRKRCYAVKAQMQSRPEDIPHGTMTAYWNWNCRCAECRTVGSRVNKERVWIDPALTVSKGSRWSEAELAAVADYSRSAREIAVELGRTVTAVNTRRSMLGLTRGRGSNGRSRAA